MSMVWILLILLIVTGSTYAWFTFAGRASTNVTPMGGSIGSGKSSLLISNHQSGTFDKTCELQLTGNPDTLKPLSTADLNQFFVGIIVHVVTGHTDAIVFDHPHVAECFKIVGVR